MPSKGWKRSASFGEKEDSPQEGEAKKRKIAVDGSIVSMPSRLASFPSLGSGYSSCQSASRHFSGGADQLTGPNSEVVQDAGGRGKPNFYQVVFQKIVQAHVEEQPKQEEYRERMIFEHNKRDEEDTDTERGNDGSEDGTGDGFQHFEDNTFVGSDESEFGSEDYPWWARLLDSRSYYVEQNRMILCEIFFC